MSDTERGCILPIAQGLAVGLFAGLFVLAVAMLRDSQDPWLWALGAATGGGLAMILTGMLAWRRAEFGARIIRTDPPRPAQPDKVRVMLTKPGDGAGSKSTQLADLPVSYDQLEELADGLLRGAPFAENTWSGGGRPFTRSEFGALRGEFLRRGWVEWRRGDSPGQGVILTAQGKAVIRSFSSEVRNNTPTLLTQTGDD